MKMNKELGEQETWVASECRIVVAYDDSATRDRARTLIAHLEDRFDDDIGFSSTWWKFRYLMDAEIAMVARHYAASADIVIFASDSPGLFPLGIMEWIESWTSHRSKDGGVMVPLIGSPHIPRSLYSTKCFYLKHVADRAGLDYLPESLLLAEKPVVPNVPPGTRLNLAMIQPIHSDSSSASISSV